MTQTEYKIHVDKIYENIERARLNLNAHHIVKLVAVSKYSDVKAITKLYDIGQRAYGENKVQDLLVKTETLDELPLEWHFIGNLQKNKINNLIKANPSLFQSLDSLALALELDKRLKTNDMNMDALLQINSANEASKSGVSAPEAKDIYTQISEQCSNINLKGVMSIGAHSDDTKEITRSFELTRSIYDELEGASICSMGMSGDYERAIECGSNMLRLGSTLFPKD